VRKLKKLITSSTPMTSEEAARLTGSAMWDEALGMEERVRLYLFWLDALQKRLIDKVKPLAEQYEKVRFCVDTYA
jgi:hypothetical protein